MSDILEALDKAQDEIAENRRKAAHNRFAATEDIQPYENAAMLKMVGIIKRLLHAKKAK